ncbi:hypothetical protein [Clostridium tertium]|jgi:hypothetical protein|uniref:hypothetical protein n=1 Tax=Clostridium tertium TaxID=1559 RepID=UPI000BE2A46F|nr:hypothetical protein [Clostridium tertium]
MIDYILIAASIYFFIKMITDLLNKRTYIKASIDSSVKRKGDAYINFYDYKRNEILPRAVEYNTELEEFRINKKLIISIELQKNKI